MGIWEKFNEAVNRAVGNMRTTAKDFSEHPKESLHQINDALPEPIRNAGKQLIDDPKGTAVKLSNVLNPFNLACTVGVCTDNHASSPVATPAQPRQNSKSDIKNKH